MNQIYYNFIRRRYGLAGKPKQHAGKDAWNYQRTREVMGGIKSMITPIFPGNKIYYNFIRPHSALDGKTPPEAAGIGISGR